MWTIQYNYVPTSEICITNGGKIWWLELDQMERVNHLRGKIPWGNGVSWGDHSETSDPPGTDPSTIPLPVTPTAYWGSKSPSQDEWEQCNAYVQGLIMLNVKNPIGHGVNLTSTAAESWKSLTDIQGKVTDIGRLAARNSLWSIHHTKGNDLDTHFCLLWKAWKRYNDQGGKMDDTELWMVVLASMPREWMVLI